MKPRGVWTIFLLLLVFSAIAFLLPFDKNEGFWIAYSAGLIAILSQVYFFVKSFKAGSTAKSKFYGFPIARIGAIYLIVQLILSIAEIVLSSIVEPWIFAIVNIIVLIAAALGCISTEIARDEIVRQDESVATAISGIKTMQTQVLNIKASCKDTALEKQLDQLAASLRYSDPISSDATSIIESKIQNLLDHLSLLVSSNDIQPAMNATFELQALVTERNNLCKMAKH